MVSSSSSSYYDRQKDLQEFDSTKLGVKGLVDSGIHHRISVSLSDRLIGALKAFHQLPPVEKTKWHGRDISRLVDAEFFSNYDFFKSKAASWRDTLQIRPHPTPNDLPDVCRNEVMEWDREMKVLGLRLLGLFSEGLGLPENKLKSVTNLERLCFFANYYPYCPESNKTIGIIVAHTDPGVMVVLLQDMVGGLQPCKLNTEANGSTSNRFEERLSSMLEICYRSYPTIVTRAVCIVWWPIIPVNLDSRWLLHLAKA